MPYTASVAPVEACHLPCGIAYHVLKAPSQYILDLRYHSIDMAIGASKL